MERLIERCCGLDVHKATVSACVRVTQRPSRLRKNEEFSARQYIVE